MLDSTIVTVKDYAKEIVDKGFALIPCYGYNTKEERKRKAAMMAGGDPDYQTGVSYERFMSDFYKNEQTFIGVRCGDISKNMECLDFDNSFGDAQAIFQEYCKIPAVIEIIREYNLFIEETISGGRHLVYLVEEPLTKITQGVHLARRLDTATNKPLVLIEIRTTGLYFVTYPSIGYTPKTGSLLDMKPIPLHVRDFLIEMARSFEEFEDVKSFYNPPANKGRSTLPKGDNELRPGDDYDNDTGSIDEMKAMLIAEGWNQVSGKGWCRPGKSDGSISATLGHIGANKNVLYVFTTNAHPFEAGKCYTPFRVLTLLHYNGNFSDCARALGERGYGSQKSPTQPKKDEPQWGKAYNKAREVLKRSRTIHDVTTEDLQMIANDGKMDLLQAQAALEHEYNRNPEFVNFDSKGIIEQSMLWIKKNWVVRRDLIKQVESVNKHGDPERKEYNSDDVYLDLKQNAFKTSKSDVDSILNSSFVEDFNPIHDFFERLPEWKPSGKDWIKEQASFWKCDNEEHQEFWASMVEKHLVRAVHCALNGIENRYILILLGPQEDGKSTYIRKMCIDDSFYTQRDMFSSDPKDNLIAQFENFFWNFEEIDGLTNVQLNKLKAAISMAFDKVRDVFGRKAKMRIRIVTYWGTGNKDSILTDDTGNSRFLVFRGRIKSHDYNNTSTGVQMVPPEQLWSQVYYLYKQGENYKYDLSTEDKKMRDSINSNYEVGNDTESTIIDLFESGNEFWSTTKMARHMRKQSGGSIFTTQQIVTAMKKINQKKIFDFEYAEKGGQRGYLLSAKQEMSDYTYVPQSGAY
jgi:predicted P-loop ATPase